MGGCENQAQYNNNNKGQEILKSIRDGLWIIWGASRFHCNQVDNGYEDMVDRPLLDGYHGNLASPENVHWDVS